jgi:hypothetical protein
MNKKFRSVLSCTLVLILHCSTVYAWKPYTHIYTSDQVRNEVVSDGHVIINDRRYKIREEIAQALVRWPEYFNAGVVGPDGLPDLTYGQSVIHPERTGQWLQHIYNQGWEAQSNPAYSEDEKSQILAFTYGYLAHAAGDMWAHTFVNDFARGVFPSFLRIPTDRLLRDIAIRHLIVEAYVGDATPGYDGNPQRTLLKDGDWSDDETREIKFSSPAKFIYNALIDPAAAAPNLCGNGEDDDGDGVKDDGCPGGPNEIGLPELSMPRGPVLDFFLQLRSKLQEARKALKLSEGTNDESLDIFLEKLERFKSSCISLKLVTEHNQCRQEWLSFKRGLGAHLPDDIKVKDAIKYLSRLLLAAYLRWWEKEIDKGLMAWGELGLATTRALFNPQARRDEQNKRCREITPDTGDKAKLRARCEDSVVIGNLLLRESESFMEHHLPSMLGLSPKLGKLLPLFRKVEVKLDKLLALLIPFKEKKASIDKKLEELRNKLINRVTGIDLESLDYFVRHPAAWLDIPRFKLPKVEHEVELFGEGERKRLDRYMGFERTNHLVPDAKPHPKFPYEVTRLDDSNGVFDPKNFAAIRNTITTIKLALLDGEGLNQVIEDVLNDTASEPWAKCSLLYPALTPLDAACSEGPVSRITKDSTSTSVPANFMINSYRSTLDSSPVLLWLRSIDSDHAWRRDGRPRFYDLATPMPTPTSPCPAFNETNPCPRSPIENGGNGTFPLWRSCDGRKVFRKLFRDWEKPKGQEQIQEEFPDYGDRCDEVKK